MALPIPRPVLLALVLVVAMAPSVCAANHNVFHVGHSLTDQPLPDYIDEAASQCGSAYTQGWTVGGPTNMQLRWGNPPISNWQNHAAPNKGVDSFPRLANASGTTYDVFVLCPGTPIMEQYFVDTDTDYAGRFLKLAYSGVNPDDSSVVGPGTPGVQAYVYQFWHGTDLAAEAWYDDLVAARARIESMADGM